MRIVSYSPQYTQGVADLIVPIQREEFQIEISHQDQPDLMDIPAFYQQGAGGFWLALDGEQVVGTIALKDIGQGGGALRKMFVAPSYRGRDKGVAKALLDTVLDHAKKSGMTTLYLGTTAKFLAAHRFYEKNGFVSIGADALPDTFPRMTVDTRFYTLGLGDGGT